MKRHYAYRNTQSQEHKAHHIIQCIPVDPKTNKANIMRRILFLKSNLKNCGFITCGNRNYYIKIQVETMNQKKGSRSIQYNQIDDEQENTAISTINIGSYRQKQPSNNRNSTSQSNSWKVIFYAISAVILLSILFYYFYSKCDGGKQELELLKKQISQRQSNISLLRKQQQQDLEKVANLVKSQQELSKKIEQLNRQYGKTSTNSSNPSSQISTQSLGTSNVIDVKYDSSTYQPLPINPMRKNANGKGIADVVYKDDEMRKKRDEFIKQRISFVNSKSSFPNLFLAKYNFIPTEQILKQSIAQNQRQWIRLQAKFKFSTVPQLPMCLVVPGYNNNANFRIQGNLNSIFTQNYTNYKVVIVDDASTDGSGQLYRNYFNFYSIDKSKYFFVENKRRATALQNIYNVSMNICSIDSVVLTLDGDDELIGRNVLKQFNWAYQTKKAGVVYSNFYWYQQPQTIMYGFTSQYTQNQRNNNLYRGSPQRFSQLRSYRAQLIHQINPKDLQDDKGAFFTITYDFALFFPLMELSCGRVSKVDGEFHYLYNIGTGMNDYQDRGKQTAVDSKVRNQKKYSCYKEFDQRMKK